MSRYKKTYVGKIGYCSNKNLGLRGKGGKIPKGGHYVYIREVSGGKCNVNVITSLEKIRYDENGNLAKDEYGEVIYDFPDKKIKKVKNGYLYPIPKGDADFPLWSAINLDNNINGVKLSDIKRLGEVKIKRRHKWFVGKYSGKYTKK